MALRIAHKKVVQTTKPAVALYRYVTKQVPRVLTLYDISMDPEDARLAIQALFRENAHVKDPRVIDMLVSKANMELEETLMQWKQRVHLITLLERGQALRAKKPLTDEERLEKFFANCDDELEDDLFAEGPRLMRD